ncbi:MAG: thiaminase/transcriptional activator TenA [Gammaproteobacteria bacterium]|jgi:thiaminase/transcriptional activator TenA
MTDAHALWTANTDIATACLNHPFVQGLATGALPRDRFAVYVGQDAFFLEAFTRAYALALAKSPDRQGLVLFRDLLNGVANELTLHRGYAKKWGIDLTPTPLTATSAYTDFLLATAGLETVGYIIAAMTPCMRLYAWLGQSLKADVNPQSLYFEWVETYADPEFESMVCALEAALNRYGGDEARVGMLYRRAMGLELAFFESAWVGETKEGM